MNDEIKNSNRAENEEELNNIITLTDEDGKEIDFEVIGDAEIDGVVYYAMTPAGAQENNEGIIEYALLKLILTKKAKKCSSLLTMKMNLIRSLISLTICLTVRRIMTLDRDLRLLVENVHPLKF
jgi:uncharacterized protein YrzB (UPF0473 family)